MSEYKCPIKVSTTDPICSASALGTAIIGILFDKKGSEIREAISARVKTIDNKISEYLPQIDKIDSFVKEKKIQIRALDVLMQERDDAKKALLVPYTKKLDKLRKEFQDQLIDVFQKRENSHISFEDETYKLIGPEAVKFEESFDDYKGTFSEIDELLKRDKEFFESKGGYSGFSGYSGHNGAPGYGSTGSQGPTGAHGSAGTSGGAVFYNKVADNISGELESNLDLEATNEDKALARLNSLKDKLLHYSTLLFNITDYVKQLKDEKRRLSLIHGNINPIREYKLDLNKLSAFGFEDLDIQA